MSTDYGVFEASSTDGHEEEQRQRQATRDLGRAIEAAREGFGDFLGSASDKQDYQDRLALVMNDLMQKVADSGVMPVPGVMRKVKAALRPEFRTAAGLDESLDRDGLQRAADGSIIPLHLESLGSGPNGTHYRMVSVEMYPGRGASKQVSIQADVIALSGWENNLPPGWAARIYVKSHPGTASLFSFKDGGHQDFQSALQALERAYSEALTVYEEAKQQLDRDRQASLYGQRKKAGSYNPMVEMLSDEEIEALLDEVENDPSRQDLFNDLMDEREIRHLDSVGYFSKRKQAASWKEVNPRSEGLHPDNAVWKIQGPNGLSGTVIDELKTGTDSDWFIFGPNGLILNRKFGEPPLTVDEAKKLVEDHINSGTLASHKQADFDPNISDENLLAGLQIAEALNHDGSNQAKVDELRAEVEARGLTPLKTSRRKQAGVDSDANSFVLYLKSIGYTMPKDAGYPGEGGTLDDELYGYFRGDRAKIAEVTEFLQEKWGFYAYGIEGSRKQAAEPSVETPWGTLVLDSPVIMLDDEDMEDVGTMDLSNPQEILESYADYLDQAPPVTFPEFYRGASRKTALSPSDWKWDEGVQGYLQYNSRRKQAKPIGDAKFEIGDTVQQIDGFGSPKWDVGYVEDMWEQHGNWVYKVVHDDGSSQHLGQPALVSASLKQAWRSAGDLIEQAADDYEADTGKDVFTSPDFLTQYLPRWADTKARNIDYDELVAAAHLEGFGGYTASRKQANEYEIDFDDMGVYRFLHSLEFIDGDGLDDSLGEEDLWGSIKSEVDFDRVMDLIDDAYQSDELSKTQADRLMDDLRRSSGFYANRRQAGAEEMVDRDYFRRDPDVQGYLDWAYRESFDPLDQDSLDIYNGDDEIGQDGYNVIYDYIEWAGGRVGSVKQAVEIDEWEEDRPGLGYAKATRKPGGGWEVYIWDEAGQNETLTPVGSSEEARRLFYDVLDSYPGSGYDHIDF